MAIEGIHSKSIARALRQIARARPLDDCPLVDLACVRARASRQGLSGTREELEWTLVEIIEALVQRELRALRKGTEAGQDDYAAALRSDFGSGVPALEGWSALYHAYLSPGRPPSLAEQAGFSGVSESTYARRRKEGCKLLADTLRSREVEALQAEAGGRDGAPLRSEPATDAPIGAVPAPVPPGAPPARKVSFDTRSLNRELVTLLANLREAALDPEVEIELSHSAVQRILAHEPADLETYRLGRVAEWSQPRHKLDTNFVELSLLVDRGEGVITGRWHAREEQFASLSSVLEAVAEPAVVVLGAPGSGKSSLLRHYELETALRALRSETDELTFFLPLSQYEPRIIGQAPPNPDEWLAERWAHRYPGLPSLDDLLRRGRVTLLLDALNEMPHGGPKEYGERVRLWKQFLHRCIADRPGNRLVFSCRSLDFSAPLSTSTQRVPQLRIEPLDDERVIDFLQRQSLSFDAAMREKLIELGRTESLRTPYMLRLLVDQVRATGRLPEGSVSLFTGFVLQSLIREIELDNPLLGPGALIAPRDYQRLVRTGAAAAGGDLPAGSSLFTQLGRLAFEMQRAHEAGAGAQVRATYGEAVAILGGPEANEILQAATDLGVLDEDQVRDEVLFFHQLLQEYFAARHLARHPAPDLLRRPWRAEEIQPTLEETIAELAPADPLPPLPATGWEETSLMAAALARDSEAFVRDLMAENLPLAGRVAVQPEVTGKLSEAFKDQLRWALVRRSRDPEAELRARIAAGDALGWLGDPRFERCEGPYGPYLMPPMVEIPGGRYWIGTDDPDVPNALPLQEVEVEPFSIGKFPVTNAEWALFMESGGYEDGRWWDGPEANRWWRGIGTGEGAREREREWRRKFLEDPGLLDRMWEEGLALKSVYERWKRWMGLDEEGFERVLDRVSPDRPLRRPDYWLPGIPQGPTQPVTGISCFEAQAYSRWISSQNELYHLQVQTVVDWHIAVHRAKYFERGLILENGLDMFNSSAVQLRERTPVGVFPLGDSLDGVSDVIGNTNEWSILSRCVDELDLSKVNSTFLRKGCQYAMLGGSWMDQLPRCPIVVGCHPSMRSRDGGMRLRAGVRAGGTPEFLPTEMRG